MGQETFIERYTTEGVRREVVWYDENYDDYDEKSSGRLDSGAEWGSIGTLW